MSHSTNIIEAAIAVLPVPERRRTFFFASFVAVCGIAAITIGGQNAMAQAQETALSCSLSDDDKRASRAGAVAKLWEAAQDITALENGYALQFEDEHLDGLLEFIAIERKCCPFLSFTLDFRANSGPIWISMTGPDGAKEILEAELEPVLKRFKSAAVSNAKEEKPGLIERLINEVVACCTTEKK